MRRFVPRVMLAATVAVSAAGCAAGGSAGVDPNTDFGGRVLVMVPDLEGPQGARVANELRRLITETPTHAAMNASAIEAGMARYQVTEEMFDEVRARQLAPLIQARLVSWGTTAQSDGVLQADVKFIDPATGDEIEADASGASYIELAAAIFSNFQEATTALEQVGACNDQVAQSQWQQAVDACGAVLAVVPTNTTALLGSGRALAELDRHDEAFATFSRVLEADATNQNALLGAARAAGAEGRTQEAVALYNRYIDINGGSVENRLAVANTAAQDNDFASAFEIVGPEAAANRSNTQYQQFVFAVAAAAGAADSTQSTRYYTAALEAYPAAYPPSGEVDVAQLTNAIAVAVGLGRADEAIRLAGDAAQRNPNNSAVSTLHANALRAAGRHQEAIDALNRVIAADANAQGARLARGQSLLELGQTDEALADFTAAAQAGQGQQVSQILFNLANTAYTAQDFARAATFAEPAHAFADGPLKQNAATIMVYSLYQQANAIQQQNQTARQVAPAREIVGLLERALPVAQTLPAEQSAAVLPGIEALLNYNRQIAG